MNDAFSTTQRDGAANGALVLGPRAIRLLAVTGGVAVGTVYFPQVLPPLVAHGLHVSLGSAALLVPAVQVGYAAGMVLLVPLADRVCPRELAVVLLGVTGLGLVVAGSATHLAVLLAASVAVGATTVAAQVLGPWAAGLVAPASRGEALGIMLAGSIAGILLARSCAGLLAQHLGWRAPYFAAALLSVLLAAVLRRALPATRPTTSVSYARLVLESFRLLRAEPELRHSTFNQASVFAAFCAAWTTLTLFLTGHAYNLSVETVALFGFVSAATFAAMPTAGRLVDRHGSGRVNAFAFLGVAAAAAVLLAGNFGGPAGLTAIAAGMLLLDVAMQAGMVANKARIVSIRPDARARINSAYMTSAYLAGGIGSYLGTAAYDRLGWSGVCGLTALLAALPARLRLHRRSWTPCAAGRRKGGNGAGSPLGSARFHREGDARQLHHDRQALGNRRRARRSARHRPRGISPSAACPNRGLTSQAATSSNSDARV